MPSRAACLALLATLLAVAAPSQAAEPAAPDATQVVARLQESLAGALGIALAPAWADAGAPRPVVLLVDVTPNTRKAAGALREALGLLPPEAAQVPAWQIGALGERLAPPEKGPEALVPQVAVTLARETPVRSTFDAIERSLRSAKGQRLVVVYLADWRFEDDADLEKAIAGLRKKQVTLSVVGSEAAFNRAWSDGIVPHLERRHDSRRGIEGSAYYPGIGRSPFAAKAHDEPWHGGETAYPHRPYRWRYLIWRSEFSGADWLLADMERADGPIAGDGEPVLPEELRRRLPPGLLPPDFPWPGGPGDEPPPGEGPEGAPEEPPEPPDDRHYPLPSAFGPYGLMRAAGVTGGRYVLWSWNPSGRRRVQYEYGRCNLFPPDLRDRRAILADVRRDPHAQARLDAWHALAEAGLLEHVPPLRPDGRTPQPVDENEEGADGMPWSWDGPADQAAMLRGASRAIERLDPILARLEQAVRKAGEAPPGPPRRHEADALYLLHVVRVARFQVGEALAAGREVPREAWKRRGTKPGVAPRTWIRQGRDPDQTRIVRSVQWEPYDTARGHAVLEERRRLLERFRGTPIGEEIALNTVDTFRPTDWTPGAPPVIGRSPTESTDDPPPPTPGGPSGGGGPTTGK